MWFRSGHLFFHSRDTNFQIFAVILLKKSGKPVGDAEHTLIHGICKHVLHQLVGYHFEIHGILGIFVVGDDQVTALAVHGNYMAWDALEGFGIFFFTGP